jgi:hypothetical protein
MVTNFGPPIIDWSPLSKLGETYDASRKRQNEYDLNANRQKTLAALGGSKASMSDLGHALLTSGDVEGGMAALRLAQSSSDAAAGRAIQEKTLAESIRQHNEANTRADRPTIKEFDEDGEKMPYLVYPDGTRKRLPIGTEVPGPQSMIQDPTAPMPLASYASASGGGGGNGPGIPTIRPPVPTGPAPGGVPPENVPPSLSTLNPMNAPAAYTAGPAGPAPPVAGPVAAPPIAAPEAPTAPMNAGIVPRASRADPLEPDTAPFIRKPPPHADVPEWRRKETERIRTLGKPPALTQAMRKDLGDREAVAGALSKSLDRYDKMVNDPETGTGVIFNQGTPEAARVAAVYEDIILQAKEAYKLGVLNGKDYEILERTLEDARFGKKGIMEENASVWNKGARIHAQVDEAKQALKRKLDAARQAYGVSGGSGMTSTGVPWSVQAD